MTVQAAGILVILLLYAAFFLTGVGAGGRGRPTSDSLLLSDRNLHPLVCVLTLTATWVGGGYINGTAEAVYDSARGLLWAQAPWGYALSLIVGGLFFAGPMRRQGFTTLLDLFEKRYTRRIALLLLPAALLGELFWSAAILAALGTTLSTLLGLPFWVSVCASSLTAIVYTRRGGLAAVSRTDVLQLACIAGGLCLALPFLVSPLGGLAQVFENYRAEFGEAASLWPPRAAFGIDSPWGWMWLDSGLLLVFGGIPWQVYFQRILATRNAAVAVRASIWAGVGCLVMALPPVLIGTVGVSIDWAAAGLEGPENPSLILPYLLRHMTPPLVAALGLGAVAAAVMSSVDSSFLSAASMYVWNFRRSFGPPLSERGLQRSLQGAIVATGVLATALALSVQSVYTLWYLCADVVYTVLFPQLVAGLYFSRATPKGAVAGIGVGFVLRLGGGEALLGLPAFLPYPMTDPELGVLFPFRTAAMLASLVTIWAVSRVTRPSSR